ncbi:hypothetical protein Tco_0577868, partial [Tanacetum coccineum]
LTDADPRGGRTGGQTGRGGGRTGKPTSRVGGQTGDQGGQGGNQGIRANRGDDEVPNFSTIIAQQLQDLLPTIIARVGFSWTCNPKDYMGKGCCDSLHSLDLEMESFQDMSGCGATRRTSILPVHLSDGHAAYTDHFHELARLVPYLVTLENKRIERYIYGLALQIRVMVAAMEPTIIQSVVLKAGMLTDEAIRNGSLNKNTKKRGNSGKLSKKENIRDDNKISKTGHFARDCRAGPRMVTSVSARNPTTAQGACFECGGIDHYKATDALCQGRGNNGNQAHGGAFMMGAEEARQDPNIVTEPSDLGFSYAIEIANGQLVEINKEWTGCHGTRPKSFATRRL